MEKLELTANAVWAVRVQNIGFRQGWKGVCKLRCYVVWFLPVPKDGVGLERCRRLQRNLGQKPPLPPCIKMQLEPNLG